MKLSEKQAIFSLNVSKLIIQSKEIFNIDITLGEAYRTKEQQSIYYSQGLTQTIQSRHQLRLAIDLHIFINGEWKTDKESYKPLALIWKNLNPLNDCGYFWGWDFNHFEMK
jgi:hypothetical protein